MTDTKRIDWLEKHCYTVTGGDHRTIVVTIPVKQPTANLRVAIDRAMEDKSKTR